jgi:hypothetical protein
MIEILAMSLFLTGCPVAMAGQLPAEEMCVIDRCENKVCTVETPEGTVDVEKEDGYREGMKIECPIWLIEPT